MRGTILRYKPRRGKRTFGYSFDAGGDENGKRIRRVKRGFRTEAEAQEALRRAIEEHERTPAAARTVPTFAEFFERWHSQRVTRTCGPKTEERYHELGQYAVRMFGDVPVSELDAMRLEEDMNRLLDSGGQKTKQHPAGRPLAPKTVRHIAFLVQGCLEQAVDWDIIPKNPMAKVPKPKVPKRRPKVVDHAGFDKLLRRIAGRAIYPAVVLSAATGIRRGELCALEWTDVDWDKGILEISKSLSETKKHGLLIKGTKSGETRCFSIPAEVVEVLREHKQAQDRDRETMGEAWHNLGLIFARPDGFFYSPDKLGTRIRTAMQSAGLPGLSLHSLRHSHASQLLSQGAPITAVAERLGHASPSITLSIYSHALPADNAATAKLWNDAMASVIQQSRAEAEKNRLASNGITKRREKRVIPMRAAS